MKTSPWRRHRGCASHLVGSAWARRDTRYLARQKERRPRKIDWSQCALLYDVGEGIGVLSRESDHRSTEGRLGKTAISARVGSRCKRPFSPCSLPQVAFIHPRGNDAQPLCGEGVLIELVQAPPTVLAAFEAAV